MPQIIFPHSTNQTIVFWCRRCRRPHDYDRQHQDKSRLFKIIICATITIYGLFLFEFQNVGEGNIGIKDLLLYANVIINPTKNEIISRFCFVFIS